MLCLSLAIGTGTLQIAGTPPVEADTPGSLGDGSSGDSGQTAGMGDGTGEPIADLHEPTDVQDEAGGRVDLGGSFDLAEVDAAVRDERSGPADAGSDPSGSGTAPDELRVPPEQWLVAQARESPSRPPVAGEERHDGLPTASPAAGGIDTPPDGAQTLSDRAQPRRWTVWLEVDDFKAPQPAGQAAEDLAGPLPVTVARPPADRNDGQVRDRSELRAATAPAARAVAEAAGEPAAPGPAPDTVVPVIGGWVQRNWEYLAAAAAVAGGVVAIGTGVGGPLGVALLGGALLGAGTSAGVQKFTRRTVNWRQVAVSGLLGTAAGGLGVGLGMLAGAAGPIVTAGPMIRGAVAGGGVALAGGMINRRLHGGSVLDPLGMATDLAVGVLLGAVGAADGGFFPTWARTRVVHGNFEDAATLGRTLASGEIKLRPALPAALAEETLRHEMVHLLLWFATPFARWIWDLPSPSHLLIFVQEAAAEGFMLLSFNVGLLNSLRTAVLFPFAEGYISGWRIALEAAGAGTLGAWVLRKESRAQVSADTQR
ncbi:MAG TPA: hypothetical protein VKG45_16870 [Actinomycetes bacterium]|nr:hypothetical protein [Actinomycetes bacterium]